MELSAEQMFKKLEYKKIVNDENRIMYDNKYGPVIIFKIKSKEIRFSADVISPDELQAINRQCSELGWL